MVAITHAFTSSKGDGTDPTLVQPSHWNAQHTVTMAATQRLGGRNSAGSGPMEEVTIAQALEWLSSTRGSVIYRGASGWTVLGPGSAGQLFQSGGAGADPSWATPSGGTSFATSGQYRGNTAGSLALSPNVIWADAAPVTITYGATVTPDMSTFINGSITLTGNMTLANPTNTKPGQSGYIRLAQDATGSRTISYGTAWKFPTGMVKTLSTAANSIDVLWYTVHSSTEIECSLSKAYA